MMGKSGTMSARAALRLLLPAVLWFPAFGRAETVRYLNGHWLGRDGYRDVAVDVSQGIIAARGAKPDRVIDLQGRYVIPALGEGHNHNLQNCRMAEGVGKDYLGKGILYSAQLFATDPSLAQCRALFSSEKVPNTAFARIGITSSTGHPIGLARDSARAEGMKPSFAQLTRGMLIADDVRQLRRRWPHFSGGETDFVKLILIDARNSKLNFKRPGLDGYNGVTPAVLREAVRLAHASKRRVVAHVDTADDFFLAVQAGVDTVGHLPGYRIADGKRIEDYRLSEETAWLAAQRGIQVIPTMAASAYYTQAHPEQAHAILDNYTRNLQLLRKHGVTVLTGSDRFEASVLDELDMLEKTEVFTRSELLRMTSVQTPRWMFPDRRVGCLDQGCEASFNVYDRDPLGDLAALRTPVMVSLRGAAVVALPEPDGAEKKKAARRLPPESH
jgi:hypothetical protein